MFLRELLRDTDYKAITVNLESMAACCAGKNGLGSRLPGVVGCDDCKLIPVAGAFGDNAVPDKPGGADDIFPEGEALAHETQIDKPFRVQVYRVPVNAVAAVVFFLNGVYHVKDIPYSALVSLKRRLKPLRQGKPKY